MGNLRYLGREWECTRHTPCAIGDLRHTECAYYKNKTIYGTRSVPTTKIILEGTDMSESRPYTIFFSAGEPSGDLHGANLIRQLQKRCPNLQAVGYGGSLFSASSAGCGGADRLSGL